jgi:two-component system, NtrC family, nitrogen regulation response regulator NtrX
MSADILIIDDEEDIRELIAGILQDEGYETRVAGDSDSALREIESRRPSLLILDIWLQGSKRDGLEVLRIVKSRHRDLPVIMISGHGNIETAVAAIKLGAYDFIEKPFQADKLVLLVSRATEANKLRRENEDLKQRAGLVSALTGRSAAINTLRQVIEKVAPTNSRVLITGPPGSGKELVARLLHEKSSRAEAAFVVGNSASIEPHRMESELFGIEQNGTVVKTGLFEQAHGGTLFLDEISDMPLPTQAKILRVLTDQTFVRVGGSKKVQVDIRVISASAQDLLAAIQRQHFREDLYHRLNVVPVRVPPLNERREDIPELVEHFLEILSAAIGRSKRGITDDALSSLQACEWPGNVRQLRNIIERMVILGAENTEESIDSSMLPPELKQNHSELLASETNGVIMTVPLREAREEFEREYLRVQIMRFGGNISRTATFIGMERSALHRKLKTLGLSSNGRDRIVAN